MSEVLMKQYMFAHLKMSRPQHPTSPVDLQRTTVDVGGTKWTTSGMNSTRTRWVGRRYGEGGMKTTASTRLPAYVMMEGGGIPAW